VTLQVHPTTEHVLVAYFETNDVGFMPGHRPRVAFSNQYDGSDPPGPGFPAVTYQKFERYALIEYVVDDNDVLIAQVEAGRCDEPEITATHRMPVPSNPAGIQQKVAVEQPGQSHQWHNPAQQHAEKHARVSRYQRLRVSDEPPERGIDFGSRHDQPRAVDRNNHQLSVRPGRA